MALEPLVFKQLEQIDKKLTLPDSNAVDLEKYGIPQKFSKFVSDIVEIFKTLQEDSIENEKNRLEQLAKVVYTNHKQLLISTFSEKVSNETAKLYESLKELILKVSAEYILKKNNTTQKIPEDVEKYVDQQLSVFFSALFSDLDELFTIASTNTTQPEPTKKQEKLKQKEQQHKSKSKSKKSKQKQKETTDSLKNKEPVEITEPTNKSKNSDNKNNQKESDKKIEQKDSAKAAETTDQQSKTNSTEQKNNKFISELQHIASEEEPEKINVLNEKNSKSLIINTLSRHAKPVSDRIKNVLYINTRRMLPDKVWWNKKLFRYKHDLTKRALNSTLATNIKKIVGAVKTSHYTLIAKKAITRINLKIQNVILKYVRPVLNNVWNRQTQQLFAPIVMVASGTLILVGGILQAAYSLGKYIFKVVIAGFKAGIKLLWNGIKALGGIIKKAFNVVSNLVTDTLKWIFRYPGMFLSGFFFKEICGIITAAITGVLNNFKELGILNFIKPIFTRITDRIKTEYDKFGEKHPKVRTVIDMILNGINITFKTIGTVFSFIKDTSIKITNAILPSFNEKFEIATAIKTGNTENLSDQQHKEMEDFLARHPNENFENISVYQIVGELVGVSANDAVKNASDNITTFFSTIKTTFTDTVAKAVKIAKEDPTLGQIIEFIEKGKVIDYFKMAEPFIAGYVGTQTLAFTYPGLFAAIKAVSPTTRAMITAFIFTGLAIKNLFKFRDDAVFSMHERYAETFGFSPNSKEQRQSLEIVRNNIKEYLEKNPDTTKSIDERIQEFDTVYQYLDMARVTSEKLFEDLFNDASFKNIQNVQTKIPYDILRITNSIVINGQPYQILTNNIINEINNIGDIKNRNIAIRNVLNLRNHVLLETLNNFLNSTDPANTYKTASNILSDKYYFNKFATDSNVLNFIIEFMDRNKQNQFITMMHNRDLFKIMTPTIQASNTPTQNIELYQPKVELNKPISVAIKRLHVINVPTISNTLAGFEKRKRMTTTLAASNSNLNAMFTHFMANNGLALNTPNFHGRLGDADETPAENAMIIDLCTYLTPEYDTMIKGYDYSKDNSDIGSMWYIIQTIVNYAPYKQEFEKRRKYFLNKYKDNPLLLSFDSDKEVRDFVDFFREVYGKYVKDECLIPDTNRMDIMTFFNYAKMHGTNEAWKKFNNAIDIFTHGNAKLFFEKTKFDKNLFDNVYNLYSTKITAEDIYDELREIELSKFKSQLSDDNTTIDDILGAVTNLQSSIVSENENKLEKMSNTLLLYNEIISYLEFLKQEILERKEQAPKRIIPADSNKSGNRRFMHENYPLNNRNTVPTSAISPKRRHN